jgi:hypothetical protein
MFRKLLIGAVVVGAVLAPATSAWATLKPLPMHAGFVSPLSGGARLVMRQHTYAAQIAVQGLQPGHTYDYFVGLYQDSNHDGIPEGGLDTHVCRFTLGPNETGGGCRNHGPSPLKNWLAPQRPDLVWAELYMVVPNTENLVQYATFS